MGLDAGEKIALGAFLLSIIFLISSLGYLMGQSTGESSGTTEASEECRATIIEMRLEALENEIKQNNLRGTGHE